MPQNKVDKAKLASSSRLTSNPPICPREKPRSEEASRADSTSPTSRRALASGLSDLSYLYHKNERHRISQINRKTTSRMKPHLGVLIVVTGDKSITGGGIAQRQQDIAEWASVQKATPMNPGNWEFTRSHNNPYRPSQK
jgi:hypothetical protein